MKMYEKILVPLDGSPVAARGLEEAIALAKRLGSRVRLVHVVNEVPWIPADVTGATLDDVFERLRGEGESVLRNAQAAVHDAGIEVDSKLIENAGASAGACVVREAEAWPADLIVCGTHGRRGLRRIVLGSDAEHIVRESPVPVLLVRTVREPRP